MKPPRCEICRKGFKATAGESGGIYFKRTEEETAYMARMKAEKKIGHPKGYGWFCKDHYLAAKSMQENHLHEVIQALRKKSSEE